MARPTFQDIIPPERRSIKKITIPNRSRSSRLSDPDDSPRPISRPPSREFSRPISNDIPRDSGEEEVPNIRRTVSSGRSEEFEEHEPPRFVPIAPLKSKGGNGNKIFIISGIALIILAALVSTVYAMYRSAGATVAIVPQTQQVSINAGLSASLGTSSAIQFQTVSLVRDGELAVPATTQSNVQTKATGSIVIYNAYSTASQKLIANTRFETSAGLVFRISKAVTVPGMTTVKGQSVPGSITVTVTADQAGANYNIPLSDFTVPGFEGTAEYAKFYGRSKTAMTGGYSGTEASIDPTEVTDAVQKIEAGLQTDVLSEIQKNVPDGYVLPGNAYYLTYATLPETSATTSVTISEEATFHGFVFNESELASEIAKRGGASLTSLDLGLGTTSGLAFKITGTSTTTPWNLTTINFNLSGTTTLVSVIDPDQIRNALAGQPRTSLDAILANYPGIATVNVKITPFWNNHFPSDPANITVSIATSTP